MEFICIKCPIGCKIKVEKTIDGFDIKDNKCKRGYDYVITELTHPMRIVTSTVVIKKGVLNRLPVKTDNSIPKEKIFEVMDIINGIIVEAPIKVGDILLENILDLNVNIVATRNIKRK